MTFLEKLKLEHPDKVREDYCHGCPCAYGYEDPEGGYRAVCGGDCEKCWNREISGSEEQISIEKLTNSDIHKIIDDAMKNKDRSVHILISSTYTSISVNPSDNDGMKWKRSSDGITYTCSMCGGTSLDPDMYCKWCGEQRTGIVNEGIES